MLIYDDFKDTFKHIIYFLLKKWDKKQNEPKTVPQSFPGAQSY